MTRIAVLGWFLSPLFAGCLLTPTDDGAVSNTTAPLPFSGYDLEASASVQVRAWDFTAGAMTSVGAPVRSSAAATDYNGTPLYAWSASRALAPRFWHTRSSGGSCAHVAAATTHANGRTYNLMTVESTWAECLDENPTVGDFSRACRSNHDPFASIYTTSWSPATVLPSALDLAGLLATSQIAIHFDNYQPNPYQFCNSGNPDGCPPGLSSDPETYKFYNPNASFIARDGASMPFSITPSRANPMTVYIDDMTSRRIDFRVERGRLVMGVSFEPDGPEIRMNCIRNIACAAVDGRTIDFSAPRAELAFDLAAENDSVVYSAVTTTFTTGLSGNGDADRAAEAIAAAITDKLMNDASIRASVSAALTEVVRGSALLADYPVRAVAVSGGTMTVLPGCPRS